MHPEMASPLRPLADSELIDASRVRHLPQVSGLAHRTFWLDHSHQEAHIGPGDSTSGSYYNAREAYLVAAIAHNVLHQSTSRDTDLVILTPYQEQVYYISRILNYYHCKDSLDTEEQSKVGIETRKSEEYK